MELGLHSSCLDDYNLSRMSVNLIILYLSKLLISFMAIRCMTQLGMKNNSEDC